DFIKFALKRNLGVTSKQAAAEQLDIAIIFSITQYLYDFAAYIGIAGTAIERALGSSYGRRVGYMLVGASNAVKLTDGLDGLLAGTAAVAFGAFALLASYHFPEYELVTMFALATVGALLGFLVFNAHPAKVFMGDTGSLSLGAA